MLTRKEAILGVGGAGINEEHDAYDVENSRLSAAGTPLAYTDHATYHNFAGAPLSADDGEIETYETNSGFPSVTNTQDSTPWDTISESIEPWDTISDSIEPSEPPVPAAASFSRTAKLERGRAKLWGIAVTLLAAPCVLVALKLLASRRMSIADQSHMKREDVLPDVLHDKTAAKAEQGRTAALDDLENLLQLLDNNMGTTWSAAGRGSAT